MISWTYCRESLHVVQDTSMIGATAMLMPICRLLCLEIVS